MGGGMKRNEGMKGEVDVVARDTLGWDAHTCPLTNRTYTQTTLYHTCGLSWQSFKLLFLLSITL